MERRLRHTVTPDQAGMRVDAVLREVFHLTGSVIRRIKWLPDGILLDGQKAFVNAPVAPGQVLEAAVDDPARPARILPAPGPVDVVFEDEHLVVLNKQAGVLVHPVVPEQTDTLGNFLLWHYAQTGQAGTLFHPVHRLDRGTTGLMVAAKHPSAQTTLKNQLHTPDFQRRYLALTVGAPEPPAGTVDAPIQKDPASAIAHRVHPDGLPARTRYETLSLHGPYALVRLVLDTGRTHQIRVHMAHLGHPLVGDFLYGAEDKDLIPRPALHSHFLSFLHPVTLQRLTFTQPLPPDMARLLTGPAEGPPPALG